VFLLAYLTIITVYNGFAEEQRRLLRAALGSVLTRLSDFQGPRW
jgi:hypothetical protein